MAADKRTAYLQAYKQLVTFIPFLSSFFVTKPTDIVNAESVKIDIKRGGRKIAPVISNITQKGGKIEKSQYTQKEFTPPVVALSGDFAPGDLIEKVFGKSEYASAETDPMAQLQLKIMDTMEEIEAQINRAAEFQASQIFQTGEAYLYDDSGNIAYSIDFFPKATHFPTVSTSWSDDDSDPDADIVSLYEAIKKDGKVNARNVVFGKTALVNYLKNSKVADKFDSKNVVSGIYDPNEQNPDVNYLGEFTIGAKKFKAWYYEGEYEHPSTGTATPFVAADKVLLLPDAGAINVDLRKVYCKVPKVLPDDPRFSGIIPTNLNLDNRAYLSRIWGDNESDTLNVELKGRPLCIPVSIDVFGCIDTEI